MSVSRLPAEQRREQILLSAIRLFEERPHTEVSMTEVAAAAGVARPLVHHYFGTHRQLYLEVLRRLYFIPPVDRTSLHDRTVRQRLRHLLDRWLTGVDRHQNTWLAFSGAGPGQAPDVAAILSEADELIATRLLEALEVTITDAEARSRLLALTVAWGGMAKTGIRQWLVEHTLTREDLIDALTETLLTLIAEQDVAHRWRAVGT